MKITIKCRRLLYAALLVCMAASCAKNTARESGTGGAGGIDGGANGIDGGANGIDGGANGIDGGAKISRIISTAPSNTEILAALGLAGKLIAVDTYSKTVEGLPSGLAYIDFLNPDAETLIELEPDIIIANAINRMGSVSSPLSTMEALGIQVVYIPVSRSMEDIARDIVFIAELLDVKDRGEALAARMRSEVAEIAAIGGAIRERRGVYFEVEAAPHAVSFGQGVFLHEMLSLCGADNILADKEGYVVINGELVIMRNPDVILTNASEVKDPVAELYARPGFENTNAHQNRRVYFIDPDSSARPSHNAVKALKQIALCVYPEYYGEAD